MFSSLLKKLKINSKSEDFGNYLSDITPTKRELLTYAHKEHEKAIQEELIREIQMLNDKVEKIKEGAIETARNGKKTLSGVLTRNGYAEYSDEHYLQVIKRNVDDDFRTCYYEEENAKAIASALSCLLDDVGVKNHTHTESATSWYYESNGKGGRRMTYSDRHKGMSVVCFSLRWK